ncbi:MAG: UDP-N-acetylmuramoyl-L-alanyl-D-glutamate--2,6-diaminopimelate ligase [Phycisphaerae bacterium]|nr:UDP-N-acetylmuramoyl-L-alanyl-D-glutamate--2,6-diaminopimelate ligase [Phycisphaerae bacterium]
MALQELIERLRRGGVNVCIDSRQIKKGDCFVAIAGSECDGHDYIIDAVKNGAKFVVAEKLANSSTAQLVIVKNSAKAAGTLAQASLGDPSKRLVNLAVTGTNGKTTVAFLVRSIINAAGYKCGLIGTVCYDTGAKVIESNLTTPDQVRIAKMQAEMVEAEAKFMVTEASSHAIFQDRLSGIDFAAAAFTNLTGDHLDYHKNTESYLAAKGKLFENLSTQATAVLNAESDETKVIAKNTKARVLWYGIECDAEFCAKDLTMSAQGTQFTLESRGQSAKIETSLAGRYNVSNILAAAGLAIAAGIELSAISGGVRQLKQVPGRLERIEWGGDFSVVVDYAHTDDALKNVLSALRGVCEGRLIVVFGCGGDRDKTKRPRMAKIAESMADIVVVTSDNPRTENSDRIIEDITAGFRDKEKIIVEADRERAIAMAIESARKDDIVLIAGKGHEDYQIIGKEKRYFSDRDAAKKCLGVYEKV